MKNFSLGGRTYFSAFLSNKKFQRKSITLFWFFARASGSLELDWFARYCISSISWIRTCSGDFSMIWFMKNVISDGFRVEEIVFRT